MLLTTAMCITSCSEDGTGESGIFPSGYEKGGYALSDMSGEGGGDFGGSNGAEGSDDNGNTQAGVVTAGEWCDLTHWPFASPMPTGILWLACP